VLFLLLGLGLYTLSGAMAEARKRFGASEHWQTAAAELGLTLSRPKEQDRRLHGELGGVPVRADLKYEKQGKSYEFRVTLSAGKGGRIPQDLVVHSDSLLRSMARLVDGQDEQIGDPDFDEKVELPTLDAAACAALSYGARERLSRLVERGGEVRQGMVAYDGSWTSGHDCAWLVQMLRSLAHIARLLSVPPSSLHQRLADNAVNDPSPGVRLRNLQFIADPSTRTPPQLVASVSRSLLGDVHPRVRLLAAQGVGAEGHVVLAALAADPRLATPLRVRALDALGTGPAPRLDALSALFTGQHPPELVCAALAVVARQRLSALAGASAACTRSEHEAVRVAAASALGALAAPQSEPLLIGLLSDESAQVQQASAEALGLFGSVSAVEPLLPLAEGFGRSQLRQAARGAIGRIQSRLGNVEAGRLSLAEDQELAGAVDLADAAARAGELSLAEEVASDASDGATRELVRPPADKC
jgi:hypothetical protein